MKFHRHFVPTEQWQNSGPAGASLGSEENCPLLTSYISALLSVSFSPPVPSLQSSSSFSLFIHVLIAFNQSPQPHLSLFPDCQDLTLQLILFLTLPLSHLSYVAASVYAPAYLASPAPHCNILFGSQPSQNLTQCPVLD